MLSDIEIQKNWEKFRLLINNTFSGDRKDRLNEMYDLLEERIVLTPASGKEHFHNAFPGGYIDHVLRVIDFSLKFKTLWKDLGFEFDFTDEELIFSAMHHDLGKVGDVVGDYYLVNDSQWHREKMGLMYKFNDKIHHMPVSDRTFWMLQNFGIKISQLEFIGIKCTDGMYDDANETYLRQAENGKQLKSNIAHILHQADFAASKLESYVWKTSKDGLDTSHVDDDKKNKVIFKKKDISRLSTLNSSNSQTSESQKKIFDDLFK